MPFCQMNLSHQAINAFRKVNKVSCFPSVLVYYRSKMVTDLQIFNGFTQLRYKSTKSVNSYDNVFP